MILTQTHLVKIISTKYSYKLKDVKAIIDACKEEILNADEISFRGFGLFKHIVQQARTVNLPNGEVLLIPAKRKLIARLSPNTKNAI